MPKQCVYDDAGNVIGDTRLPGQAIDVCNTAMGKLRLRDFRIAS